MDKYLKCFGSLLVLLIIAGLAYLIINIIILYFKGKNALNETFFNTKFCQQERCQPTSFQLVQTLPINISFNRWRKDIAKYCSIIIYSIAEAAFNNVKPVYPTALVMKKELYNDKNDPIFGVIFTQENNIWVSFRGTFSKEEYKKDFQYKQESLFFSNSLSQSKLDFLKTSNNSSVNVHAGFEEVYLNLRDDLLSTIKSISNSNPYLQNIIISGHSLGAAIATLAGIDLAQSGYANVGVYNFASPRIGDSTFKSVVDNIYGSNKPLPVYRIVNISDIIPNLPTSVSPNFDDPSNPYMYDHCGTMIYFQKNRLSILNNHLIPVYMEGIEDM